MKVSGVGNTTGPSQVRKSGKADKAAPGSFAKQLGEGAEPAEEAAAVDAPATVASVDALLAAQESEAISRTISASAWSVGERTFSIGSRNYGMPCWSGWFPRSA